MIDGDNELADQAVARWWHRTLADSTSAVGPQTIIRVSLDGDWREQTLPRLGRPVFISAVTSSTLADTSAFREEGDSAGTAGVSGPVLCRWSSNKLLFRMQAASVRANSAT